MKKLFTTAIMLSLLPASLLATNVLSYSDGTIGKSTIFRTATENTGLAVKIPAEKLRLLTGKKISALDVAIGSKKSNDGNVKVFISTSLESDPIISESHPIERANVWLNCQLSAPYEITGNEPELYIGYTIDIPKTYQPLSADMSSQMEDVTYALFGDEWRDVSELNVGQGNIRAVFDSDIELTDLIVKPLNLEAYYKAGSTYSFSGEIFNFGTQPVSNFKISMQVGTAQPQIYDVNETIEPGSVYVFKIPDYTAEETGELEVKLEVIDVNGAADGDPTDNVEETDLYFYPQDMERAILMESFTGQECSNCPAGHRAIESVMESWSKVEGNPEIIEVTHHAGYYPDNFTMKEDIEYTTLYSGSTYAPAVMVNRMRCNQNAGPVFNTGEQLMTEALTAVSATMPYVALNLESEFDPATRKLDVKVQASTFNEIPEDIRTINVMLCQNNLKGRQAGMGSDYIHNNVFRGALSGNAWGIQKPFEPNTTEEYVVSYTIPDYIYSSYYENTNTSSYQIPAVPEDMYIVAYVGTFDEENINKRYILNCAKVRLGESKMQGGFKLFDSIESVEQDVEAPVVRIVDGKVSVNIGCRSIDVYNLSGMRVADGSLENGIYIVRVVTADGKMFNVKAFAK